MRPPPRPDRRSSERGVALLIVLVVLFIVAVLMVDITLTATTARRSARNASQDFLMDAAIDGRLQVALAQLRYDFSEDGHKADGGDDRWARPEYTDVEGNAAEAAEDGEPAETEEGVRVLGDSEDVKVTARIEDEERKFNLNLLMHPDAKMREASRERFAVLLDRFREDTPLDLSRTKADELRDRVVEHLERAAPGQNEQGKLPVPKTGAWRLLTPDELRYVEGFEDSTHAMPAEGILYDARDPQAVRDYMADPESGEAPESFPGLLRYVTIWSGGAWLDKPDPSKPSAEAWGKMLAINVNTAEKPVLETLFYRNPADFRFAESIIEYREAAKDGTEDEAAPAADSEDPLEVHQYFQDIADLTKDNHVDGLTDEVLERNGIRKDGAAAKATDASVVTVKSDVFSLDFLAEIDRSAKQVRTVVFRHAQGFQTLLREVRADPRFEKEDAEAQEQEAAAAEEDDSGE